MRVLIADKFDPSGIEALEASGCQVTSTPDLTADDLPGAIAEIDPAVLIVRSTKVHAAAFESARSLGLIVRAGAGYDTIDVDAASALGIYVANCPGKNSLAVAELAWGLILCCDRRIPQQTAELREGRWSKKEYSKARGLYGRTLGLIGTGQIAMAVAERGRAFGMPIIAWSRSLDDAKAKTLGIARCDSPADVAASADVVSVSIAATPETKQLCGRRFFEAIRPGAYFINTSRGSIVDEAALLAALDEKSIRAGLDVYDDEPAATANAFDSKIARHPNVVGTHHIGASTDQAQQAIADEAVRIVATYQATGEVPNVVNRCAKSPATCLLVVRHLNKPGVLAHVVGLIGDAQINIEEMENVIYQGAAAACARIRLDAQPPADVMQGIFDASKNILGVELTDID